MRVLELAKKLDDVFGFLAEARGAGYLTELNRVLKQFEGDPLRDAYEFVMADWTERFRPMPAEFAKHCRTVVHSDNRDDALMAQKLRGALESRDREFRSFINRTLEHHGIEIGKRAAPWGDTVCRQTKQPFNVFRSSVAAFIEVQARRASWYQKMTVAPHSLDIGDIEWECIDEIARRALPMVNRGSIRGLLPERDPDKEGARLISMRANSYDGFQPATDDQP